MSNAQDDQEMFDLPRAAKAREDEELDIHQAMSLVGAEDMPKFLTGMEIGIYPRASTVVKPAGKRPNGSVIWVPHLRWRRGALEEAKRNLDARRNPIAAEAR